LRPGGYGTVYYTLRSPRAVCGRGNLGSLSLASPAGMQSGVVLRSPRWGK
jgi:hypothetical protein